MPQRRLSVRTIREVLRLKWQCGLCYADIAASCRISATAARGYVARAKQAGLTWPLPDDLQDDQLERRLFPQAAAIPSALRGIPDWKEIHGELKRKGVTLQLLWEEYRQRNPDGYRYSQFCFLYGKWRKTAEPTMLQRHKAGDKLFVDYAGVTVPYANPKTGEIQDAQIFVAALGASSYIFAEATGSQSVPDWTGSHVRCFGFLGGVPRIVVPDNLKSGVTSPCRYEPDINPAYLKLANHYGVAVVPARVRKPRDKAKVENAVQQVERQILARLRNHTFHALEEINAAIRPLLAELNEQVTKSLGASRRQLFETIDRPALRPLPERPLAEGDWSKARVNIDYHIAIDSHRYSVPYALIGCVVEIRLTDAIVEIFQDNSRVASHMRSFVRGGLTTVNEHMPPRHQRHASWQEPRFLATAKAHGPQVERLVAHLLDARPIREQAFGACMGILRLGEQYGSDRLDAACDRALTAGAAGYKSVAAILKRGLDRAPTTPEAERPPILHDNIRGADYFSVQTTMEVEHA